MTQAQEAGVPRPRRLIACCDGTWNKPDREGHTTNVVRLVRAIKPVSDDGLAQIVYYHPGIGTGNIVDRWIGGGTGVGLSDNVRSTYAFFINNYKDGDELFLFGFSRGAYTARSVAGLIGHVGLLRKHHMENFDEVWDYYRLPVAERDKEAEVFLSHFPDRTASEQVRIKCIGVWDTVGALGIPGSHFCQQAFKFHDTNLGPGVENAFQALAIDERRRPFAASVWHPNARPRVAQNLQQVWFPGVHSNIGGGYRDHALSDAALFWMASKIAPFLDIDEGYLCAQADCGRPYAMGRLVESLTWTWRVTTGWRRRKLLSTDGSERIHESARLRAFKVGGEPLPAPYRDEAFRKFLRDHEASIAPISDYERRLIDRASALLPDQREQVLPRAHQRRSICDRIVAVLGG